MIRLNQAPPAWGLPNISPACLKLETWLRMTGIPHEVVPLDMSVAPKGKIPFIEDDGVKLGDSTLILEHLKQARGKDPDEGLSAAERGVSLAFRRMMKENFYWVMMYSRYKDERNWNIYRGVLSEIFSAIPEDVRKTAIAGLYETMVAQMHGHGLGRHTAAAVYQSGLADVTAVLRLYRQHDRGPSGLSGQGARLEARQSGELL
jgi:glutathione S-transferase